MLRLSGKFQSACVVLFTLFASAVWAQSNVTIFAQGLNNPRGLKFGPGGGCHLPSLAIPEPASLVSERVDGIEERGFACRVIPEEDTDQPGKYERKDDGSRADQGAPAGEV